MLIRHWNVAVLLLTLFNVICAQNCTDNICYVKPGTESFAEQVIQAGIKFSNRSFSILAYGGNYNATNGNYMNFINFTHVFIKRHPDSTMPVNIMCPGMGYIVDLEDIDGVGFENSTDIEISGLHFMRCGAVSAGLYFQNSFNIFIHDSVFHHNTDNGIQFLFGNNLSIINSSFYSNIGLQPDNLSDLITDDVIRIKGVGLGLFFENQNNISVRIEGCNFTSNIAYKAPNYNSTAETRPYDFIPFGNGGGIYLKLNRVNHSNISILNSNFSNNTAIHQGGAVVMIPVNSVNNTLNIFRCNFVGNKVLGFLLGSLNVTVTASNIDIFTDLVNHDFSITKLTKDNLKNLNFDKLRPLGGSGGAIAVTLFGSAKHNILRISNSCFIENGALIAGAIDFIVRDLRSELEDGVDSNQAFISKYVFNHIINDVTCGYACIK